MKSAPFMVPAYEMNHWLSSVIELPVRVTVISRSLKTTPVKRSRCVRTQQLSGPATETKRCVTHQFVVGDAFAELLGAAGVELGAVGVDVD